MGTAKSHIMTYEDHAPPPTPAATTDVTRWHFGRRSSNCSARPRRVGPLLASFGSAAHRRGRKLTVVFRGRHLETDVRRETSHQMWLDVTWHDDVTALRHAGPADDDRRLRHRRRRRATTTAISRSRRSVTSPWRCHGNWKFSQQQLFGLYSCRLSLTYWRTELSLVVWDISPVELK